MWCWPSYERNRAGKNIDVERGGGGNAADACSYYKDEKDEKPASCSSKRFVRAREFFELERKNFPS